MYFLTNKEGLIVAASNDFLTTIGTREICSISSMLHNQLIVVEDDKLEIPAKELKYDCSISTMYSAFGELKLYSLKEIKQKVEDEDIAYLKELKSGKIEKDDNEYSIPEIPTLHKSSEEIEKEDKENIKLEADNKIDTQNLYDNTQSIEDTTKEESSIELIDVDTKESIDLEEQDKKSVQKVDSISLEDKEEVIAEKIESNEDKENILDTAKEIENKEIDVNDNVDVDSKKEDENTQKVDIDEDRLKLIKEIEQITADSKEDNVETVAFTSTDNLADEIIKEQEDKTKAEVYSTNEALDLTKELKEEKPFVEAFEVKEESIENILDVDSSTKDNVKEEVSGLKKITKKLFPWGKKDEDIELDDKDYEIDLKPAKELEATQKKEELPVIETNKEIEIEKIKSIELEEEDDKLDVIDIDKDIAKPKEEKEESQTKEVVSKSEIEDKKEIEDSQDSHIVYKLIDLQVKSINLQENANKLSIDSSSYKMLVENYLDEIEKYNNELLDGSLSTINMLADAGELLSLDILTQKLNKLKDSEDRASVLKEISLISSLLREKLEDKQEETFNNESVNLIDEVKEEVKTEPVSVSPKEIIDITSAETLLKEIEKEEVYFDPQRAVEELNLPKKLIIEFVQDFVTQSKEHLPVMVEAYKNGDIQTIQTTAHMLKGAASNLRLDTIAENLFKIQKENSLDRSGDLIKDFVAKLKGLEEALASMENLKDED